MSHDLRSPLAALRVLAEALEDDALDEAARHRHAGQLSLHVRALGELVDDLFELSRLGAGDVEWPTQPLPLHDLVAETVEAMQAQARAKSISTLTRLEPELPAAEANPEKVQRVLFNLAESSTGTRVRFSLPMAVHRPDRGSAT